MVERLQSNLPLVDENRNMTLTTAEVMEKLMTEVDALRTLATAQAATIADHETRITALEP